MKKLLLLSLLVLPLTATNNVDANVQKAESAVAKLTFIPGDPPELICEYFPSLCEDEEPKKKKITD